jgi:hypothetical protein
MLCEYSATTATGSYLDSVMWQLYVFNFAISVGSMSIFFYPFQSNIIFQLVILPKQKDHTCLIPETDNTTNSKQRLHPLFQVSNHYNYTFLMGLFCGTLI